MSTTFRSAKIKYLVAPLFLVVLTVPSTKSWGWGERGHFTTGYSAARMFFTEPNSEAQKKLGAYFTSRDLMFGHLSNLPDISWRDARRVNIATINSPTHHFDVEFIIGKPAENENLDNYLDKIRNLEPDLAIFLKKYDGQPNPIREGQKLKVAVDSGSAPFRIEQLFNGMLDAFKCAKSKEAKRTGPFDYKVERLKYREPIQKGRYSCSEKTSWAEDLGAAAEFGGVMGHFVEDLAQPFHVSADYDGYAHGQGGIHSYFETDVLQVLDEDLIHDVLKSSRDKKNQTNLLKRLKLQNFDQLRVSAIAFHEIADSYSQRDNLYKIDKKVAVIKEGSVLSIETPQSKDNKKAERKSVQDEKIKKAFRPVIVERLTLATVLLYKLWYRAWHDAGEPDLHEFNYIAAPYALDVPFIVPDESLIHDDLKNLESEL